MGELNAAAPIEQSTVLAKVESLALRAWWSTRSTAGSRTRAASLGRRIFLGTVFHGQPNESRVAKTTIVSEFSGVHLK
jgi:hypothetical protein